MASSISPVSAIGDASAEKETHVADEHHVTPATNGYYNQNTHPQPDHPPEGPYGHAPVYNETDSNPLPQLVFGDAMPETVKHEPAVYPDAAREDIVSGPAPFQDGGEEHQGTSAAGDPWYKRKSVKVLGIIGAVAIVGILAVLFGTLGGLGVLTNNRATSASTYTDPTQDSNSTSSLQTTTPTDSGASSSTASSTTTSSSSSKSPSATPTYLPECTDYSKFYQNMSSLSGNVPIAHGVGFFLPKASSQEDCCAICYNSTKSGCNLWGWDPTEHANVPCTIVLGYAGDNPDARCPYGHTNSSAFSIKEHGAGIGGTGPCGSGGTIVAR